MNSLTEEMNKRKATFQPDVTMEYFDRCVAGDADDANRLQSSILCLFCGIDEPMEVPLHIFSLRINVRRAERTADERQKEEGTMEKMPAVWD
jgi:hypothetical protein